MAMNIIGALNSACLMIQVVKMHARESKVFSAMCCENWIFTDRRMKWDHFLSQRNRKYTRELLIRLENMKLL